MGILWRVSPNLAVCPRDGEAGDNRSFCSYLLLFFRMKNSAGNIDDLWADSRGVVVLSACALRMCCAAHVLCLHARVHKYTRPHALTLCVDWLNARCFESDSSVQMLVVSLSCPIWYCLSVYLAGSLLSACRLIFETV